MKSFNYLPIIFISIISIIVSKIFTPFIGLLISIISLIFLSLFFLYSRISLKNKIKKEKVLQEQQRQLKEKQKQEEINRIIKERNNHIEELKKTGIKTINCQQRINTINVATSINIFQKDKIMVTFFGGKLILYSIDIIKYSFIELLYTKEFSYNAYNAVEMEENNNRVIVYGYPGIKILEIEINNNKGKEGNKYKIIQNLNCDEFNKEIIKVIELDKNTLVSISTDYLLIWYKENDIYKISDKYLNFIKYENLLILSNILKLDTNNIVLLKQANSNMTKSTIDFIEIKNKEPIEKKLINIDISTLDTGNNNLLLINQKEKIFLVGCMKGIAVMTGIYMELIHFINFEEKIKNIDFFFDKFIFAYGKYENKVNDKEYIFYQFDNDKDFGNKQKIIKKSNLIGDELNTMKYFKDGLIIIGDHEGYLQLWH